MKVSDFISRYLYSQCVTHVFELSGGMITHILDSIYKDKKINIVSMHHEQSAAFAADAFARLSGLPGIALATSGPGATNLLTGIGSCYFDSVPAVFITGQVNQHEQKGNRPIRQLGFQETDIVKMADPITKWAIQVNNSTDIPSIFQAAFKLSLSGRPGPVLIDIPMNIQRADLEVEEDIFELVNSKESLNVKLDNIKWSYFFDSIKSAQKPLILAGRGVLSSFSKDKFIEFAEKTQIPVVTSLLGIEAIEYDHPLRVGFIGAYGNRWANLAIGEADLLIVIGSRLDIRQTGADVEGFRKGKKIFHIDIETAEINNRIKDCLSIICEINFFLHKANEIATSYDIPPFLDWYKIIDNLKKQWPHDSELKNIKGINPNLFIEKLSYVSKYSGAFIADVGSHQMWTAQSLRLNKNQYFLTSGGMGAMGYALPASIGASLALIKPIVAIIGDGSMQLNIQELQTIYRRKLPIKIVVINNKSLGMIRQFQDSYFDSKHQSTVWGYSAPNFEKVAIAYGIESYTIHNECDIEIGLEKMWEYPDSPFLLQVMIDFKTNVYPKIAFGKPITEMEPFSMPLEMEGT